MKKGYTLNALTIDVEDWHSLVLREVGVSSDLPPTENVVEHFKATMALLDKSGVRATFFFLGEVARQFPQLVKEAIAKGHEVGSHGYRHHSLWELTPKRFKEDLRLSLDILEDIAGQKVKGYRAPNFSLLPSTQWAWEIMAELGLEYSSSVSPRRFPFFEAPRKVANGKLWEFPLTCFSALGRKWLLSGGRTFRLLPLKFITKHLRELNSQGKPALFYFHTYEIATNLTPPFKGTFSQNCKLFLFSVLYNIKLNKVPQGIAILSKEFRFAPLYEVLQKHFLNIC